MLSAPMSPWHPSHPQCTHSALCFLQYFLVWLVDKLKSMAPWELPRDCVLEFSAPLVRDKKLEIACVTADQRVTGSETGVLDRGMEVSCFD